MAASHAAIFVVHSCDQKRFTNRLLVPLVFSLPLVSFEGPPPFSHCLLIPRCGNDLWDRVGSGMAEKWYFRGDTLNHGIEKQPLQISLASFRSVFCESFFSLSLFLSSSFSVFFDAKNFTRWNYEMEREYYRWNEFFKRIFFFFSNWSEFDIGGYIGNKFCRYSSLVKIASTIVVRVNLIFSSAKIILSIDDCRIIR